MRRDLLHCACLALALSPFWGCSGPANPARRGRLDVDSGDDRPARTRGRAAPKPAAAEFPRLTLDGLTLPEEPGGAAGGTDEPSKAESGTAAEEQTVLTTPARNLFAIEEDPAVVAERVQQQKEAAEKAQEAAKKAEAERKKQAEELRLHPPPPQPPAIPFTFIGYFGPPENRIGVFASPGGQLTLARTGDTIQTRFRVVEIGYESAEIGFQGFKDTQRIPLIGGGK